MNVPQTIIHVKAGHVPPKTLFETALRKCPSASGFAVKYEEDGVKSLQTDKFDKPVTAENLMEIAERAKDFEKMFYLANFVTKLAAPKEDAQPYTVTVFDEAEPDNIEKSTDLVTFCVEGDFPKYSDDKSGHTDEYNFAHQVIIPMLGEIYEEVEGDIAKFTTRLYKSSFEKNLIAHAGHRAVFLFFPLEGDAIAFGDSKGLAGEYDWGTASQHLDWDKPKKEDPIIKTAATAAVAAVKRNVFGIKGTTPANVQPNPTVAAADPGAKIKTDANGVHHVGQTTIVDAKGDMKAADPKDTASHRKGKIGVSPPSKLIDTARNRWIRLFFNGKLPDEHYRKDLVLWVDPEVAPFAQRMDLETIQDVKDLELEMKTGNKPKKEPKDMRSSEPPTPKADVNDRVADAKKTGSFPVNTTSDMTDNEMIEITGILADFVDRGKVPSAVAIQAMEAKKKKFSDAVGIPWQDMLRWRDEELAILFPVKWARMAFAEIRGELIKRMDVKDLIGTSPAPKVIVSDVPINKKDDKVEPTVTGKKNIFGLKKTG